MEHMNYWWAPQVNLVEAYKGEEDNVLEMNMTMVVESVLCLHKK